ncbi:MAG: hypothetical protein JO046_13135, partial [Solirubrobacterales bacterium]|nr:hypothetical protein [Solirubrobacterales bacterium]
MNVTRGSAAGGPISVIPLGTAGGSAAFAALTTGPTAPAGGTLLAAAPTATGGPAGATTPAARASTGPHQAEKKQPNPGASVLPGPIRRALKNAFHALQKLPIPLWLWVALGAAVSFALVFAALAWRSSRRARKREKEYLAISAAAETDALTGIPNRRGFMAAAE